MQNKAGDLTSPYTTDTGNHNTEPLSTLTNHSHYQVTRMLPKSLERECPRSHYLLVGIKMGSCVLFLSPGKRQTEAAAQQLLHCPGLSAHSFSAESKTAQDAQFHRAAFRIQPFPPHFYYAVPDVQSQPLWGTISTEAHNLLLQIAHQDTATLVLWKCWRSGVTWPLLSARARHWQASHQSEMRSPLMYHLWDFHILL